jgi:Fibronectin type III domain
MIRQLPKPQAFASHLRLGLVALACACLFAALLAVGGEAANPSSGTLTTANTPDNPLVFTGGPYVQPNPSNFVNLVCQSPALPCDDVGLNVDLPAGLADTKQVRIHMAWADATADFDFRVYRRNPDGSAGEEVLSIGSSADPEIGILPAVKENYVLRIIPFNPIGQSVRVAVTLEPKADRFHQAAGPAPGFRNYPATGGLGTGAAEPTLGVNWRTGKVMFIAGLQTLRVTFDDSASPATATWEDRSFLLTSLDTLDPILYTDRDTGRTIISQLAGTNSLSALTDDDGQTWIPNEGGPLTSGVDHQTIGGGPFAPPLTGGTAAYPNAVYYCSQDAVTAFCARSDDGGLTYGPTVPMFLLTCGGIHGHVQVAPDGTVYVPNRQCNSNQGLLVSEDNGITWQIRTVAGSDSAGGFDSIPGSWDPALGVGADGTLYFGYSNGDGTAHIAVSRDKGRTWTDDQNVGLPFGIRTTAFPTVVAGDGDRAAFAFHGSTFAKDDDNAVWHLYVATTYDGGKTWHTVNATPHDPVQRGTICDEGFGVGACPKGDRNLLDFMDVQIDKQGRILVAYADGCVGCSSASGSRSELGTIARQSCGRTLFSQYDSQAASCDAGGGTPTPTPTPPPPDGNGCVYPGLKVISDAQGDQTGAPTANQQQDIEWVRVSEEYSGGVPKLVFTMKLNQLDPALLTPNASWTTLFNATHSDGTSTTYFVSADNNSFDNPAGISYNYGFVDVTNQNLNTSVGAADAGSMDGAARTITIKVATSKIKKPVAGTAGATLTGATVDLSAGRRIVAVNARTSLLVGALGTGLIETVDSTAASEYTMNGEATCAGGTGTPTPTATPTPSPTPAGNPACAVPGVKVVEDPAGDNTGAAATSTQDITSVSVAEQYPAAGGQLVFTLNVASLDPANLPPNANWRTYFNAAHADNTVTTYFVNVNTNTPGTVAYDYGFVDTTTNNLNRSVGSADSGVLDGAKKTLTVTLSLSKLRKPVAATGGATLSGAPVDLSAGKGLGAINARTSLLVGALGTGLIQTVDSTGNGAHTMAGAAVCLAGGGGGTPTPTPTVTPTPPPPTASGVARFHNFAAPPGVAEDAGEPSIGVNWRSERTFSNSAGPVPNGGTVNYFGGFLPYMLRVTFDDSASPANATWDQAPLVIANAPRVFGDPILFTDSVTGRTFVSQEMGLTPLGSTMEWTDDDGRTFRPSEGSGAPSGIDHQTVGGGPYHAPIPTGANPLYPHGVWYCSQSVADAVCSLSLDGGVTFGPAVPMYSIADCVGLHGHIKIGPDGTAYVPVKACGGSLPFHDGGKQALVVSEENGLTWKIRPIPTSSTLALNGGRDPSVAVAKDSTVYFAYQAADGTSHVAVSRDKGLTWTDDTDIGAPAGVKNSVFHAAVAGDGERAAVAYFGTTTGGTDWATPGFSGVWYLYVSTTYDRGKTWTTQNVTPGDPIQRGGICNDGDCRNLLDFFDATIDKRGRVLVGYDDGCIGACVTGGANTLAAKAVIARQSGGRRMFAEFDPPADAAPAAPAVTGTRSGSVVTLSWSAPDQGGSPVTGYNVYRRDSGGAAVLLSNQTGTSFTDAAYAPGAAYRVTAVNAKGEGPYSREFDPAGGAIANACDAPGILVVSDVTNDGVDLDSNQNTPPDPRVNIKSLSVSEPWMGPNVNKLVFTLKVGTMQPGPTVGNPTVLPPSSQWFVIWNRQTPDANHDRWYVAVKTDSSSTVTMEYGKFGVPTNTGTGTIPPPNSTSTNQPTKLGEADGGSFDAATGTLQIVLSTSKAEGVSAGKTLSGLNARTFYVRPDLGLKSQNVSTDITGDGSYTMIGNAACQNMTQQFWPPRLSLSERAMLAVVRWYFNA